ncbi:MAG: hypothetical protein JWN15_669 [Firmicutes bacterium]|nr:hypothetical protein [Bacillota bacterium]
MSPGEKLLLSAQEAADLLDIGMNKMYALLNAGEIPAIRLGIARTTQQRGVHWKISRAALERWIASQTDAAS